MGSGTWYFAVTTESFITYQLIIELDRSAWITVGALGRFRFPAGSYIYTGSAMRAMEARIRRHLSARKKCHWHIDYMLEHPAVRIDQVKRVRTAECRKNQLTKGEIVAPGFGASDCRHGCGSHLKYLGPL
jgi:Uri superfamily endonuclease